MRNNRIPKDELYEYESYLYGDYGIEECADGRVVCVDDSTYYVGEF